MKRDLIRRRVWFARGALVALLWVAWGCEENKPPPKSSPGGSGAAGGGAAGSGAAASGEVADLSAILPSYVYSPIGKRDPFKSFYQVATKDEDEFQGGVLQKFEIDQLKLTAVISGISRPMAQVNLPDGVGVNLTIGTPVGKNQGKVVRIKNDEVIVAEDYRDYMGRKVTNYITLKLYRDSEKR